MSYPKAIYLDTNILIGLRKEITTPEFQVLKNICNNLNIPILIPQVVYDEWIFHYTNEEVPKIFKKIDSSLQELENYVVSLEDISVKINKNKILKELKSYLTNRIQEVGIETISTSQIQLETLLNRAIKKIRPFKEKDKGFRDTVILYTILNYAKDFSEGDHLLITNDGDFDHNDVYKTASDFNVNLIILKSVQEALSYLQKYLERAYKQFLKLRAKKLEEFLKNQQEEIITFIREHGTFSDMFFWQEPRKDPFFIKSIKKINYIELEDIYGANAGFLPEGAKQGWVEISFVAKLKFLVTTEIMQIPWPLRLSVGKNRDVEIFSSTILPQEKEQQEEEIEKDLTIYAKALVDANDNYSGLKITNLVTY